MTATESLERFSLNQEFRVIPETGAKFSDFRRFISAETSEVRYAPYQGLSGICSPLLAHFSEKTEPDHPY